MQTLGRFWQRFMCPNLFFHSQLTAYSSDAFQSKIGYALLMRTKTVSNCLFLLCHRKVCGTSDANTYRNGIWGGDVLGDQDVRTGDLSLAWKRYFGEAFYSKMNWGYQCCNIRRNLIYKFINKKLKI